MAIRRSIKVALWVGAAALVVGLCVLGLLIYKDQSYVETPAYVRAGSEPARVLVVYYSRSGNTEGAAREVARYFDADLLRITAPRYPLDIAGWRSAADDADAEVTRTEISLAPVDLAGYDLIALGSPIWWFRPAPPLWTFVEDNDLSGKAVLLFNTGNSRFKAEGIERFKAAVKARGGRFLDHIFIRRGRIYWQKTPEEVNAEIRAALDARAGVLEDALPAR